jgi:hypothetical protein
VALAEALWWLRVGTGGVRSPRYDRASRGRAVLAQVWEARRLDADTNEGISLVRSTVQVRERLYERVVVQTPWLRPGDDLGNALVRHAGSLIRPGDCVFVSEKVAVITSRFSVAATVVRPGAVARLLAHRVQPVGDSCGISIPEKMQLVIHMVGLRRVLLAATAAALTRPFGIHGAFYLVAGPTARGMDGMRAPFEDSLLPPLDSGHARQLAATLAGRLGVAVAIVDLNDRGGCIRAVSRGGPPARLLGEILRDNPLGQRDARTPFGILRPLN